MGQAMHVPSYLPFINNLYRRRFIPAALKQKDFENSINIILSNLFLVSLMHIKGNRSAMEGGPAGLAHASVIASGLEANHGNQKPPAL
jgi:hypothetical protein